MDALFRNGVANIAELTVDIVAGKDHNFNSLVVFVVSDAPDAELVPYFLPIEAV